MKQITDKKRQIFTEVRLCLSNLVGVTDFVKTIEISLHKLDALFSFSCSLFKKL